MLTRCLGIFVLSSSLTKKFHAALLNVFFTSTSSRVYHFGPAIVSAVLVVFTTLRGLQISFLGIFPYFQVSPIIQRLQYLVCLQFRCSAIRYSDVHLSACPKPLRSRSLHLFPLLVFTSCLRVDSCHPSGGWVVVCSFPVQYFYAFIISKYVPPQEVFSALKCPPNITLSFTLLILSSSPS